MLYNIFQQHFLASFFQCPHTPNASNLKAAEGNRAEANAEEANI